MKKMDSIDRMRAESWETIFIGIVATEMGYANGTRMCNSGREVFKALDKMTYK